VTSDSACGSMVLLFYCLPFSALRAENGKPNEDKYHFAEGEKTPNA
jgi:hypothetical protein